MALTTELHNIPKNTWHEIENTGQIFDIQNTSEVMMEYTFTSPIDKGSHLLPDMWVLGVEQTVWVRHQSNITEGTISVVRYSGV